MYANIYFTLKKKSKTNRVLHMGSHKYNVEKSHFLLRLSTRTLLLNIQLIFVTTAVAHCWLCYPCCSLGSSGHFSQSCFSTNWCQAWMEVGCLPIPGLGFCILLCWTFWDPCWTVSSLLMSLWMTACLPVKDPLPPNVVWSANFATSTLYPSF